MEVLATDEFKKRYERLPEFVQLKAEKQEEIFRQNPFYPSLHTEKLSPKSRDVWSFRVDKNYRILFRFTDGGTVLFLTVGTHDWIYKFRF